MRKKILKASSISSGAQSQHEGTNMTPSLAAVGEGRINNFPNDWQECQGFDRVDPLSKLKQQVWNLFQVAQEIPNTHCFFPFYLRKKVLIDC